MEISNEFLQRAYIKMRTALKVEATAIHQDLVTILGDSAYSYRSVAEWSRRFKAGRDSVEDDPRPGRPLTASTKANIQQVQRLIDQDPRISYRDIAALTSLSYPTIHGILHDHLDLRKKNQGGYPIN